MSCLPARHRRLALYLTQRYCLQANVPSAAWAAEAAAKVQALMCYLDHRFPGKILGLQLDGLETGEWFGEGMGAHGETNMFSDYSESARAEFCNDTHSPAGCELPSAALRDVPTIGNSLLAGNGPTSAPAFSYWLSHRTVKALATLARAAKAVSGGKAFTGFYVRAAVIPMGLVPTAAVHAAYSCSSYTIVPAAAVS